MRPSRLRGHSKYSDRAGSLVSDKESLARRIERKMSRPFTFGIDPRSGLERTAFRIDLEDHDAIVTPIRRVEPLSIRMNENLARIVFDFYVRWTG